MSETYPFYSEEEDGMSKREQLEEYFSQSLEVDTLLRLCPDDEDTIYQIVDLLVDTCATNRKMLRMQAAGADSMPEGVERQGIGTPATRAATIEKLVQKGFLERKGTKKTKVLLPTDKGKALITVMPEEIQSPEMTADWETKLLRIERGEMEPETFMTEIKETISSLVKTTEAAKGANSCCPELVSV